MFGKNAVTAPVYRKDGHLRVKEIFYTLQGEGPRAGQPAIFVRLAGCNLRCYFCDTDFEGGELLPPEEVRARIADAEPRCRLVVLTGGEPLAQQIIPLVADLWQECGITTQVETAGTCAPPPAPSGRTLEALVAQGALEIVCSPKTPKLHPEIMRHCRHYKYIVRAGELAEDGLPNRATQHENKPQMLYRPGPGDIVYLQPQDEPNDLTRKRSRANRAAAVAACLEHGYRLSLQQHKIVGVP